MAAAKPAEAGSEAKKGSPMPIILAVVAVLCLGIGFLAMKLMTAKKDDTPKPDTSSAYVKVGETVPLDEFMINSADPSNDHYIKITMTLGLKEGVKGEAFKDKVPAVRDVVIMVLSSKKIGELKSAVGKLALKKTLKTRINKALGDDSIADIYYQDFAMQ